MDPACILVVDDDRALREALAEILEDEGFGVAVASDGLAALEAMRTRPPALVLLDLMMPRCDGWSVALQAGADPALRRIPLVVMSAMPLPPPPETALGVLRKPFDIDELLLQVRRFLEPPAGLTAPPAAAAGWPATR